MPITEQFGIEFGVEGTDAATDAFDQITESEKKTAQGMLSYYDEMKKLEVQSEYLKKATKELAESQKGLGDKFAETIEKIGLGAFLAVGEAAIRKLGEAISQMVAFPIESAKAFEKMQLQAENTFGPGAPAQKAIEWAEEFEDKTGVATEEVLRRMQKLKIAGFDPMADQGKMMLEISDAAQALGVSFEEIERPLMKIGVTGKITQREIMAIAEMGIPIYEILRDQFGLAGKDLTNLNEIAIDGRAVFEALSETIGEKYAGATKRATETSTGLWERIIDKADEAARSIMMEGAWTKYLESLSGVRDLLVDALKTEEFKEFTKATGDLFKEAITGIGMFVTDGLRMAIEMAKALTPVIKIVAEGIAMLSDPFGIQIELRAEKQMEDFGRHYSDFITRKKKEKEDAELGIFATEKEIVVTKEHLKEIEDERKKSWDRLNKQVAQEITQESEEKKKNLEKLAETQKKIQEKTRDHEREIRKEGLRDELKSREEQMAIVRKQLEKRAAWEKLFWDRRNELANLSFQREQENSMIALKRIQEDRSRALSRSHEDIMSYANKLIEELQKGITRSYYACTEEFSAAIKAAGVSLDELRYGNPEAMEKLKRYLEDQDLKEKRRQEDEELEYKRRQEDERKEREFIQKRQNWLIEENTKALIEHATSLKTFKARIEHQIKMIDTSKFVESFMEEVFKESKLRAKIDGIAIAAP